MKYITKQNETLDQICYNHYNQASGTVEKVLAANPELAYYGVKLPAGLVIHLPDNLETVSIRSAVKLWD